MAKTLEEIADLKASWEADGTWDIEDTEGFEDHYDELLAYRHKRILEWRQKEIQKTKDKAADLGCAGNLKLAKYVMSLEDRIESLDKRLERLENA